MKYHKTYTKDNPEETGYLAIPWIVFDIPSLTLKHKIVYGMIAALEQNSKFNACYASDKYMSEKLNVPVRTIQRAIENLKRLKLINCYYDRKNHQRFLTANSTREALSLLEEEATAKMAGGNRQNEHTYNNKVDNTLSKDKVRRLTSKRNIRLKIRRDDSRVNKIIDHWSSLGPPFAKVRNINSARIAINERIPTGVLINSILEVINIGFEFISSRHFKYPNIVFKKNISLVNFLTPLELKSYSPKLSSTYIENNNRIYKTMQKALPNGKPRSWFFLFFIRSQRELEKLLYKKIDPDEKNFFYDILFKNIPVSELTYDIDLIFVKGSKIIERFAEINDIPPMTISNDFGEFIKLKYPKGGFAPHWALSKSFWNETFAHYLMDIKRFDNNEIKTI